MKNIILDTNAYSRLLLGEEDVLDVLSIAETVYMSIFVLGELFSGFHGGKKERKNREILKSFLSKPTVKILFAGTDTAEFFGLVKNNLKKDGKLIPINDVWIGAHCLETGSVLVTYDSHFRYIQGLRLWDKG